MTTAMRGAAALATGLLVLCSSPAAACAVEKHTGALDLGVFGGWSDFSDDVALGNAYDNAMRPGDAVLFGLRAGWHLTEEIALEGEAMYALSDFQDSGYAGHVLGLRATALYHFLDGALRPFVLLGIGTEGNVWYQHGTENDFDTAGQAGVGAKLELTRRWSLRADARWVGTEGHDTAIAHNMELHLGVSFRIGGPPPDTDRDGVIDAKDKCPEEAEDRDGYQDTDGCVDPDNDGDGLPDVKDKCPDEAEDKDGLQDEDGCPEEDADGDGVPDVKDKCPKEAEDKDGHEDGDGCVDPDNDGDGVLDVNDKCPGQVGKAEDGGCPPADADGDGIPDKLDKCPNKAETFNGVKDDDGCPDGKETVVISNKEIKILQKVYFETGQATIKAKSFKLLNTVATVLKGQPRLTKVVVEGHSDDLGDAAFNKTLSQQRAESVVKYLTGKGVAGKRLVAQGHGSDTPTCKKLPELLKNERKNKRKIAACRDKNRRVQFRVATVDGKPVKAGSPVTIEAKDKVRE